MTSVLLYGMPTGLTAPGWNGLFVTGLEFAWRSFSSCATIAFCFPVSCPSNICVSPDSGPGLQDIVGPGNRGLNSQMINPTVRNDSIGISFLGNGIACLY